MWFPTSLLATTNSSGASDGEATASERQAAVTHLEVCPDCAAWQAFAEKVSQEEVVSTLRLRALYVLEDMAGR